MSNDHKSASKPAAPEVTPEEIEKIWAQCWLDDATNNPKTVRQKFAHLIECLTLTKARSAVAPSADAQDERAAFQQWVKAQDNGVSIYEAYLHGKARAAQAASTSAEALTYQDGLRAALEAVRSEYLTDPTEEHGDVVYQRAVADCENGVAALLREAGSR